MKLNYHLVCVVLINSPLTNYFLLTFRRMYIDGKKRRFLLSAKQFEQDNYYISAHEDFPMIETKPKRGYLGKVELQRDLSYLISLNQCHLCDNKLGLFTCARGQGDREVVGRIVHSIKHIKTNGAEEMEYRYMKVLLPVVTDAGIRKIWCPRSFRKINSDVPNSADIADALYYCPHMCTKYVNKMPEWSKKVNNLVLKFQGDRILTASAKNFLLYEEKLFDVVESPSRMRTNSSNSNNCSNEKEFSELQIVIDGGNGLNNIQDGYSSTNSYSKGRGNSFGYESNDNRSPGKHFFDLPENNKNYSIYSYRDNKHNNSKVSSSSLNNKQLRNNRFASSGRSNGAAYSNRNSTNNFKSGTKSNSYYQNNTDSERDDLVIESDFKDGLGSNSSSTVTTPSSTPGKSSVKGEYRKKKKKALELDACKYTQFFFFAYFQY